MMRLAPLLLLMAFAAPLPGATEVNAVAARVNESVVTESELKLVLGGADAMLRAEYTGATLKKKLREARDRALQDLIDREIILSEFNRMGGSIKEQFVDDEISRLIKTDYEGKRKKFFTYLQRAGVTNRKFRELTRKRLIVQMMRSQVTRDVSPPTGKEIRAEYDRIAGEMRKQGGAIKMRKIFIPKETPTENKEQQLALAGEIRTKLLQGADFASLATQYSQDGMARKGGDWPVMERKFLKKEIAEPAFATKVGNITPIITSEAGYTIILVEAKENAKVPPFSEVRDQARKMAEVKKRADRYEKYIQELRRKAVVKKY